LACATIGSVSYRDLDDFLEESRRRQRNVVFPDTVRNARSVDAFLWKGSPNPTLVQRVGAWLFGLTFIGLGACLITFVGAARRDGEWVAALFLTSISAGAIAVGIRIFRNGFPRLQRVSPRQ
jgi:hypothetical protein